MASGSQLTLGRFNDNGHKGTRPHISANSQLALILVEEEIYTVHEELLSHYSEFFRAALTGSVKEAKDKTVRLKDDDSLMLYFFIHWLYKQRFPNEDDSDGLYSDWVGDDPEDGGIKTDNLIHLYVFCDKYLISELRPLIMTEIVNHVNNSGLDDVFPTKEHINFAFKQLNEDTPLCKFLVDTHCYWAHEYTYRLYSHQEYPSVFIRKVLCLFTLFGNGELNRDSYKHPCDYHEHTSARERRMCERSQLTEAVDGLYDFWLD